MRIRFKTERVFNDVYFPYLSHDTPLQIYYGGASSGKSRFVAQKEVYTCLAEKRNWLILRQFANDLRGSIYNEVCEVIRDWGLGELFEILDGRMSITCKVNGAQLVFHGLDDLEKVKSIRPKQGVFEAIHTEEATQISEKTHRDLGLRLRGVSPLQKYQVLSFNPIYKEHWIACKLFGGKHPKLGVPVYVNNGRTLLLRTHYRHNKFLTADDIERIEEYKSDTYRWPVYGMGEWGVMGHVLFTNWRVENIRDKPFSHWHNGLDFGFSPDPAALVHCARRGKSIYITDGLYRTGLLNPQLAAEIKPIVGGDLVRCDCAEPKSIAEIANDKDNPISAIPVKKGKDSVWHGIQWLQLYELIVDEMLQWLVNELSGYRLKEDKDGNPIPKQPIDKLNHGIDALRYAWEDEMDLGDKPFIYTGVQSEKRHTPEREVKPTSEIVNL